MNKPNTPELPSILRNSAKLELFVMVRYIVDECALGDLLDKHLEWVVAEERKGVISLSGPIERTEGDDVVGLTVLRAENIDDARCIAEADPFVKNKCVRFTMYKWTVFEGSLSFTLHLSDATVRYE